MIFLPSLYLDSIFKSRDITLPTKVHLVKALVFPVVMYGCESWTVKKAERWRIDAFKLWCWRRFLRVPWSARRSNQSILKEISPKYSLEGLILKLKLQYFGYLMRRTDSLEKTLMLGRIGGRRRREWQRMRWLDGERVTGRKARCLQTEEIACKCQKFFSLLNGRRKQTSDIFFPSLYKFKRRFLLKYCVAIMKPGFTWS